MVVTPKFTPTSQLSVNPWQFTIISRDAMRMYKIDYRDDNHKSYFITLAKDPEDAAYYALDWTKDRNYKLIDVREVLLHEA